MMTSELRYESRTGLFCDVVDDRDLSPDEVLNLLNGAEVEIKDLDRECQKTCRELELMTAERNALAGDLQREQDGNLKLRREFGAHDDETMWQFVERMATLSDQSELKSLHLKIKEDAKQIVDLMNERDDEKRRRVYYQNIVYDVCNRLDAVLGGKTVCGTVDSPTTQVVERLNTILDERSGHGQAIDRLDRQLTEARNALTRAGVADWEPYPDEDGLSEREKSLRTGGRMRSVAERIDILAKKQSSWCDWAAKLTNLHGIDSITDGTMRQCIDGMVSSQPHEDPGRTAYVVGLELAAQRVLKACGDWFTDLMADQEVEGVEVVTALEVLHEATRDRAPNEVDVLKNELRATHDEAGRLTEYNGSWRQWAQLLTGLVGPTYTDADLRRAADVKMAQDREELMATIRHMRDKLTRVAELVPPYTESVDGRQIMAVVMEQLPPSDPTMVEIERANMLKEIDDLLQARGAWVGGRLDSIDRLLRDREDLRCLLSSLHRWA
jgi:hypothetical protein